MTITPDNIYLVDSDLGELIVTAIQEYRSNRHIWACYIHGTPKDNISLHKDKFKKHLGVNLTEALNKYPEYFI